MAEPDGSRVRLAAVSGIERRHPAAPETIAVDQPSVWPVGEVLRTQSRPDRPESEDQSSAPSIPTGPWTEPAAQAAVLPILPAGETGRGRRHRRRPQSVSAVRRQLSRLPRLVAGQIAAAIANAQAYEEERRRAEALAEIDRAKTAFFSNVSHEFRTPLTLMLAPLEDALNERPTRLCAPINRSRLETAHRNSLRLLKLVNSLLDFSRIEAGRSRRASNRPTSPNSQRNSHPISNPRPREPDWRCGSIARPCRAGLCRPGHVGKDCPQSSLERIQIHLRGRNRGRDAGLARRAGGRDDRARHRRRRSGIRVAAPVRALSPGRGSEEPLL